MSTLAITASAACALLLFAALTYPKSVLYAAIFFLPWRGLDPYFFLGLSLPRILIAVVGLATIAHLAKSRNALKAPISAALLIFIFYSVAISLARAPFLPHMDVAGGEMRAPTNRALLQIVYFLVILVIPLFVYPVHFKVERDCTKVVKVFLISLISLAVLGWIQLGIWYVTGFNPFPIGLIPSFFGKFQTADAGFAMAGIDLHRMCSLGGEPKDLGQAFAIGLFVVQAILACGVPTKQERRLRWCWLFLFFSLVVTYSTSATFLWGIGTGLEVIVLLLKPGISSGFGRALRNAYMVALIGAAVLIVSLSYFAVSTRSVRQIATGRTIDRMGLEDFDQAALGFLEQNPDWMIFGTGMGNVHLHANSFLSADAATYASGTVFRPKTGLLRMASEIGVVGIVLWLVGFFSQLRNLLNASRLGRRGRTNSDLANFTGPLVIVVVAVAGGNLAVSMDEFLYAALALSVAVTSSMQSLTFGSASMLYSLKRQGNLRPVPAAPDVS